MADAGKNKEKLTLESLQAEVAELRALLANERLRTKRETSQQSNAHHSLMAITGLFRLYTDDNGVMKQWQNWPHRMGVMPANAHISDLFGTDEARDYFKEVYDLRHQFQKPPRDDQAANWRCVFSSEDGTGPSLDTWVSNSPTGWTCEGGTASTGGSLDAAELYLSSPVELIGPDDDFRIEYMARADKNPQDLSVVVGSPPRFEMGSWQTLRSDAAGYSFVFGGMHNMSTELQRRMRRVSEPVDARIVAGQDHHCVAQRIGGRLEFVVDGETVFSVVDTLPLMGPGRGCVSLYTCGANHHFWDIQVSVRPTVVGEAASQQINRLQRTTLQVANDNTGFYEILYAGPNCFIFKNIAQVVTERRKGEAKRRALQDKLAQAQRMESLGVLAGGVAHDLNNILNPTVALPQMVIEDLEQMASEEGLDITDAVEMLELIDESARRGAELIRDLLMMSRSGDYEKEPTDVNNVVQQYLGSSDYLSLKKDMPDVIVLPELDSSLPKVTGSATHLMRIVSNLVGNGLDAIASSQSRLGAKSRVTIRTSRMRLREPVMAFESIDRGDYVVLEISDTGTGIDQHDLHMIFEPFFTKKKQGRRSGTGLGLAIVHRVVKDHNGFIDVESTQHRGTTFSIYLPIPESEAEAPLPKTDSRGGHEFVLVVDDEPVQIRTAKAVLESFGYLVTTASGGKEAIELVNTAYDNKQPYDVIVLDMMMEDGYDGLMVYEEILKYFPGQRAIVTSGYSMTRRVKAAMELGAAWLPKPYDKQSLGLAVREQLDSGS